MYSLSSITLFSKQGGVAFNAHDHFSPPPPSIGRVTDVEMDEDEDVAEILPILPHPVRLERKSYASHRSRSISSAPTQGIKDETDTIPRYPRRNTASSSSRLVEEAIEASEFSSAILDMTSSAKLMNCSYRTILTMTMTLRY
jgi:DNA-binding transcriptional ArsR family regulator